MEEFLQSTKSKFLNLIPKKKFSWWNFNSLLFCMTSSTLFLIHGLNIQLSNIEKSSMISDGVHTCYHRVQQSLLEILIEPRTSKYLRSDFAKLTQECFGQTILSSENIERPLIIKVRKSLNYLTTNVYWFYKDYSKSKKERQNIQKGEFLKRFRDMELSRQEIIDNLEKDKVELNKVVNFYKMALMIGAFLCFALIVLRNMSQWLSANNRKENREKTEKPSFVTHNNPQITVSELALEGGAEILKTEFKSEKKLEVIHLGNIVAKIVALQAEKLFTHGIILDLNIDDNVHILGIEESILHIFYNILGHSICSFTGIERVKKVILNMQTIGGTVVVNLYDTGKGFDPKLLAEKGPFEKELINPQGNLKVCQELIDEIGGRINFDNQLNSEDEVIGMKVGLIFRKANEEAVKQMFKEKKTSVPRKISEASSMRGTLQR